MIIYLGNKLSQHGYTPTSVETLGVKFSELGFDVMTKSSKKNKIFRLLDMCFTILKNRTLKPVVLIDTYSSSAFWYAYISARFCNALKLKYIPILHGGGLPYRIDKSKTAAKYLFSRSFSNIAVSDYLHVEFQKRNLPSRIIHNFLELNKYPFTHRQKLKPKILWVRSFHEIYNPQLAIKVLQNISRLFPEASLCMVGPDKDGTLIMCKNLAAELNVNVIFTGRLKRDEWVNLSRDYDIFINTTDVDNTPVSVMEAMALGFPVISTNAGGIPHLFKKGFEGMIVNKNSVVEMTQAILTLIEDSKLASEMSLRARKKAEEWDWTNIGQQWKTFINQALNSDKK